jgi:carboxymethylenebutenolidase
MGKGITLKASDGHEFAAYDAPTNGEAKGQLVVIQEIFGVNSHIREVCDSFAAKGYRAVAPAMFDRVQRGVELGYQPADIETGRGIMMKMDWEASLRDVQAAIDHVKDAGRVGVVGYCWGGSMTWLAACRLKIDAAVGYYGGKVVDFVGESPKCPTMLHFGEKDATIPMEAVDKIKAAHGKLPIYVYPGAGHGFSCDHRGSFDAKAHELALSRTMEFFGKNLG